MIFFMSDVYSAVTFHSSSSMIIAADVIVRRVTSVDFSFDDISVSGYNRQ